jgi:hypothetical protein
MQNIFVTKLQPKPQNGNQRDMMTMANDFGFGTLEQCLFSGQGCLEDDEMKDLEKAG